MIEKVIEKAEKELKQKIGEINQKADWPEWLKKQTIANIKKNTQGFIASLRKGGKR